MSPRDVIPYGVDCFMAPAGRTSDPRDVAGMYGGVQEYAFGFPRPYNPFPYEGVAGMTCPRLPARRYADSDVPERVLMRGPAWNQARLLTEPYRHMATRGALPRASEEHAAVPVDLVRSPRAGIRCARWVPEPRSL